MADGWITIGTKLDTDKFDRQISTLDKKIEKEEQKKIEIEVEMENLQKELDAYDELRAKIIDYKNELKSLEQERKAMVKADPSLAVGVDTPEYAQIKQDIVDVNNLLQEAEQKLANQESSIDKTANKLEIQKTKYQEINNNIAESKQKIDSINIQRHQADVEKLSKSFKDVGSSIQGSINKLGRMAISVLGIYSGLAMIRRASSELATYDQEYATNLEYIRYALTQAIAPVLKYIVNLAMTLLRYLNAIFQALFGVNLFANASADGFKKMKGGAEGVGKAIKEAKKELVGFDEINRLTDQTDSGTSAGAGGVGGIGDMDIEDLSKPLDNASWLNWIKNNKEAVIGGLLGIAGGLLALKLGLGGLKALGIGTIILGVYLLIQDIKKMIEDPSWENFANILRDIGIIFLGLGITLKNPIFLAIAGIFYGISEAIKGIIGYIKDPSWENFGNTIKGIGIALATLGILVGGPITLIGLIVIAIGLVVKYWENIKGFFDNITEKLRGFSDFLKEKLGAWGNWGAWKLIADAWERLVAFFDQKIKALKGMFNGIIEFFKGVFAGNWKQAWEGIKEFFVNVWNWISAIPKLIIDLVNWINKPFIDLGKKLVDWFKNLGTNFKKWLESVKEFFQKTWETNKQWFEDKVQEIANFIRTTIERIKEKINEIKNWFRERIETLKNKIFEVKQWFYDKVINPVSTWFKDIWDKFKNGGKNAWEGIKSVFSAVGNFFKETFSNAWQKVKDVFSTGGKIFDGIKEGIVNAFKNIVNAIIRGINKVIAVPFNALNRILEKIHNIEIVGKKPFEFVHTFAVPEIPQLKTGGIINMPGKGTLIGGSAIGGEAGREGVIPLTDEQAMAELGEAIGRNVVINLTNMLSMNGRIIGRELKKVQSQQDFAYNT